MNDKQRAAFETWFMSKHKKLPTCPAEWAFLKSEDGRYINQLTQTWFEIYQAALESPQIQDLKEALQSILYDMEAEGSGTGYEYQNALAVLAAMEKQK